MSQRLYRGKDIYSGEWVEGYYSKTNGWNCDDTITTTYEEDSIAHFVIPETVGQYTGVKDCNGVKIFEGDILLTDLKRPYNIVEFRNGSFVFNCNDGGKDYYDIMLPLETEQDQLRYLKVIGNVHDNPELLEEGAE